MQEFAAPLLAPLSTTEGIADYVVRNAGAEPAGVAFRRRTTGAWQDVTHAMFRDEVFALARGLVAAGINPGDRVALMSRTRYEWTLADFAIWAAGAITVPIYETSSAEQVQWILSDSGAVAVIVETPAHASTVGEVRSDTPDLRDVWQIESGAFEDLVTAGADSPERAVLDRIDAVSPDDIATIIYTSGTTGRPKGCELSHRNFVDLTNNAYAIFGDLLRPGASTLLFLPLAHVFARFIEIICVGTRVTMGHTADIKGLVEDLGQFQPTFILSVPRVFEKVYNSAEQKAESEGKGKIFRAAAATAIAWSEAQDNGGAGLALRLKHGLFDRLVYGKLRAALGGRVEYAVSGGAPLGTRLGHFYRGIGVVVLEGYGLTETTAPSTVNRPNSLKIGTVGLPLPGVTIRIADDGEILVKGYHVFGAYWHNQTATDEAKLGDWFHTGDVGELDAAGYLRITGRKKEILVTAGGKNVAPAVLEDRLRAHPLVSQCIVVGDQKPFIAALVTLDAEMLPTWLSNNGKAEMDVAAAAQDPDVHAAIQTAVDEANKAVSRAEAIRRFEILDEDFTEANGYLTPSLKLKRNLVMKDYATQVEALYS
ncbi:MAG: AMP-dependent synthetase/ligase [Actinomycetales bacterium]